MVPNILIRLILFRIKTMLDSNIWSHLSECKQMIICTQLDGFKHCYVLLTIQFNRKIKEFQVFLFNTNNSLQCYSFVSIQVIKHFHIPQRFWTEALPSHVLMLYLEHLFCGGLTSQQICCRFILQSQVDESLTRRLHVIKFAVAT